MTEKFQEPKKPHCRKCITARKTHERTNFKNVQDMMPRKDSGFKNSLRSITDGICN